MVRESERDENVHEHGWGECCLLRNKVLNKCDVRGNKSDKSL